MGDFAAQVSRVPDDPNIRRYTLDDGYSGFALDGDNIIGVFSSPGAGYSGAAGRILQAAIAAGGRRLDGFDTFLPKVYADNGFRAVARLPFNREYAPHVDKGAAGNWNYETMAPFNNGEPDVVFMVYDPANASPDTDQVIGDYQDGIDIQDTELEGTNAGDVAGGTGGRQPVGSGDVAGAGAPVARGIDEWLGSKPDTTDAKVKGEVDYAVGNGRTSPNAALAFIRHSPLFGYDTIMNEATKRDGLDFGQEFFKAHSNFTKGMGAKLAQLSRTVPDSQVPFYLDMVKAQKNDHIKKLIEGINRGTIQVSDIDPVTKTYRTSPPDTQRVPIAAGVDAPIAMGMDVTARVQAAPAKRGIAQPVETKTPERVASAVFDGAADPKGTFDNLLKGMGKMSRAFGRQVMNRQAGLKQIEQLAGMGEASIHDGMSRFAQMMSASTGRTAAMMSFGAPVWNAQKKIYEIDRSTKGLDQIFQFNGVEDYQNFQGWAYAKRDRDLMAKGKSARMTDDLRAEFEAIPAADKARYDNMLDEYRKYNQALRKLMLDSGLINQKQMDALAAENEYVPMYRQFDDPEALGLGTFFGKDGFSHPDPNIKKMGKDVRKVGEPGGGDFGDLIEGIPNNAVAVMHAASQNLAHQQIYNFMTNNLPHEVQKKVSARKLGKKEKKAARLLGDQDAVKFLENGKEVYWRAQGDPEWTGALQMALAGLSPAQLDGIDKALKGFNSFQRAVITSTPAFAIRSVVRDMGQAYVQSGTNPAAIAQKNAGMLKESWDQYSESTQALMMASGVAGYQMQGMPDVDAESFRKKVGAQESGRLHQIRQAFGQYERVVGSTELGARAALYEGELGRTGDEASAAYEALNMIDYNRKGASPAIQKLSYMILFLNPRLQGLYRLFETTTGDGPTKYAKVSASLLARGAVLGGLAMAARALTAMDDEAEEEYRALTQADRATYFHIPLHGMGVKRFLRLPKPFEVGAAFATLPVAGIDAVAMGPEGMDDLGAMAMHVFMETFSFNPTPQAIRPVAEVMLNRNMFTGREIEGMRLQGLPKSERIDAQTTGIAQVVSKYLTGSGISPAMMQHLMSGYLGPLGMLGVNTADATLAGAGIVPDKSAKVDGIFGGLPTALKIPTDFTAKWLFSSTGAERGTRYIGEFYDLHTQIKQYTSAINEAKRVGDLDKVTDLVNRSKELRRLKPYMNKVNTQMSELNRQMRIAQNSPKLTDEQRQERMAKINLRKNKIARDAIERAYEMGVM